MGLTPVERLRATPDLCDCNYEPIRGIKAGRHLPSCHYGIIEDFLDVAARPHPDVNHEFVTVCVACGERGWLHVSVITNTEVVKVEPLPL